MISTVRGRSRIFFRDRADRGRRVSRPRRARRAGEFVEGAARETNEAEIPGGVGEYACGWTAGGTVVRLVSSVFRAGPIRSYVCVVDVPVGSCIRTRGVVESISGLQCWYMCTAVGRCVDRTSDRQ